MVIRARNFSYRYAEQVLNSRLNIKQELEEVLFSREIDTASLSRPHFNAGASVTGL